MDGCNQCNKPILIYIKSKPKTLDLSISLRCLFHGPRGEAWFFRLSFNILILSRHVTECAPAKTRERQSDISQSLYVVKNI